MKGEPRPSSDGAEIMSWIYTHDNPFYPRDNRPKIWAWNRADGKLAWERDFGDYGAGGNDCGLCLMDGTLYYSTFFGYSAGLRRTRGHPPGPTDSPPPRTSHRQNPLDDHQRLRHRRLHALGT